MYCASASRVFEEPAGRWIDASTLNPLWVHSSMLLPSRSFKSLRSRKNATMAARKYRASLARSRVGVEPDKVPRRGVGDHGGAVDPPACGRVGEALDHAVDEPADLAEEAPVMAEEHAQHLGECKDHLPVGKTQQETLVHVLAEQQGALLRAGRTQMEDLAAEVVGSTLRCVRGLCT